jgi:hypothetical protein
VSNVFRQIFTFVPVVQRWQPGQKFSFSLLNFHDALCYLAFTFSTVCFENIPNSLFADLRQMSADAVERGRIEAAELKWISYKKAYRGTHTYRFLDADGREFVPKPEAKPRHSWKYKADKWQMHLARRRNLPAIPATSETVTFGKQREFGTLSSGFFRGSNLNPREKTQADFSQVPANEPLSSRRRPLEYLKSSDEVGCSEDVALGTQYGSHEKCSSPTWDELGSSAQQKKILDGNSGTCTEADEFPLFSQNFRLVTSERTEQDLLKDIQADTQAKSVIETLSRRFGAKIVEVRDTKVSRKKV